MMLKNYLLLSSLVIYISCTKEVSSYSLAQIETNKMYADVCGGAKFDAILEEYFYESNEIVDSKFGYRFYSAIFNNLLSNINKSIDSVQLYWNEEIEDVNYFWWAHDTVNCNENLLILFAFRFNTSRLASSNFTIL
ncbi:MAG: hypothetical protein GQ574_00335 [Crocinitomix sp.]|nr:hypothetical protein [Crocinitomix sp.]